MIKGVFKVYFTLWAPQTNKQTKIYPVVGWVSCPNSFLSYEPGPTDSISEAKSLVGLERKGKAEKKKMTIPTENLLKELQSICWLRKAILAAEVKPTRQVGLSSGRKWSLGSCSTNCFLLLCFRSTGHHCTIGWGLIWAKCFAQMPSINFCAKCGS